MAEWFSSFPVEYQLILAVVAAGLLVLVFIGVASVFSNLRKDVFSVSDLPASPLGYTAEGSDNEDEDDFEPEVGMTYVLTESPYPAQIRVSDEVEDNEVFGDLIIELPPGAKLVSLQRVYSDDYEEYLLDHFVVLYSLNGEFKTQTWEGNLYLHDYEVYPKEIIVREFSAAS